MATWSDMLDRKVRPTEETLAAMVDACVANGAMDEAIRVSAEMKTTIPDFATPASSYQTLIRVLVQRKQQDKAFEMYEDMRESKVQPNLATFNALIDVCARSGNVERAGQLFRDMCMLGIEPDLITYSTVIKGYCVQGDLEHALQLFSMMQKKGIRPDAILFNSILDGCAKRQMLSLTDTVLNDMEVAGIAPSNVTLSILVKLYGRLRDLDQAFRIIEEYPVKYDFTVNPHVKTCLMSACIANNNLDKAKEIYKQMCTDGVVVDAKTNETLVNGCLKQGDMKG